MPDKDKADAKPADTKADKTPEKNVPEKSDKDVLAALKAASKGLLFPSESDRPVKAFLWNDAAPEKAEVTAATLQAAGKLPEGAAVETVSPKALFAPVAEKQDWFDEAQNEAAERFQSLLDVLSAELTGLQAFRISGSDKDDASIVTAYVVGCTEGGNLAGVSTQLVET